ncbi:hypothetical protein BTO01_26695 [Vibrio jasicida]|uniref:hypothetical protein n=1 Tax=Vibrio jasicida TaxID=766224 RepID=UPI000CF3D829|nr:hypothetical protein [Vibrio jasicida]PQJ49078.1 hypothetical protein BTO01_26695 [Vibrio jasicida]
MSRNKQKLVMATCGFLVSLNAFSSEVLDVSDIKFEDDSFQKCVLAQKVTNPTKITKLVCRQFNIDSANEILPCSKGVVAVW